MDSNRPAFTIVELLVALILMAVAATGLVSALTSDRQLRNLAASHAFAADRTRERIEWLAALPCSGAASGSTSATWGAELWYASPVSLAWNLTDSLVLSPARAPVVIQARVACP
jgi:prepilin-type N-terminal cleavage/methylation domain-containing protein